MSKNLNPYNANAERAIIGSILLQPSNVKILEDKGSFTDFQTQKNRILAETLIGMHTAGMPIEPTSLINELENTKNLVKAGGEGYIEEIIENAVTSAGIEYYIKLIRELRIKNDISNLVDDVKKDLIQKKTVPEIIEKILNFTKSLNGTGFNPENTPLAVQVREYIKGMTGIFKSTDIYFYLQLSTINDKKNVSMILKRMSDDGLIERTGKLAGQYRIIDLNTQTIDFMNVRKRQLNIQYPLGEEQFIWTMPKSIIVLAGSPDAGKTAWMLNFVRLNMNDHKIKYFSSEMGDMELYSRLILAKDIEINQWKFKAEERTSNFPDVIDPDGVNVIDFLEIGTNFFEIGTMLTDLHSKLKTGICVVAIQKDPKAEIGRGASFSLEKPRLYMTIDQDFPGNILRIKKAKNWRNPERNPNGMERHFKIVQGINLKPDDTWDLP